MDDLGNIIYVVIAIGWFFWNAFRKSQAGKARKPKPVRSATPDRDRANPEEEDDFFGTLEEMIRGQFEEDEPEVQHRTLVSPTEENDGFLHQDLTHSHLAADYRMSTDEGRGHRVHRQVVPLQVEEVVEQKPVMDELFPNGFDLRQAVVSNAILERPYA